MPAPKLKELGKPAKLKGSFEADSAEARIGKSCMVAVMRAPPSRRRPGSSASDPGTLMQRLNAMPADKVEKLVHSANTVNPNDKGHYQLTAGNDREVWGPEGKDPQFGGHYLYDTAYRGGYGIVAGSPFPVADTDPNPHSLTALRGYARALTGEPLLG